MWIGRVAVVLIIGMGTYNGRLPLNSHSVSVGTECILVVLRDIHIKCDAVRWRPMGWCAFGGFGSMG